MLFDYYLLYAIVISLLITFFYKVNNNITVLVFKVLLVPFFAVAGFLSILTITVKFDIWGGANGDMDLTFILIPFFYAIIISFKVFALKEILIVFDKVKWLIVIFYMLVYLLKEFGFLDWLYKFFR